MLLSALEYIRKQVENRLIFLPQIPPILTYALPCLQKVTMQGHIFRPVNGENIIDYHVGVPATFTNALSGAFQDHDFVDTTLTQITVEVAGGVCNKELGTATIDVRVDGCDAQLYNEKFSQPGFLGAYEVPSHAIKVRITDLADHEEALKRLAPVVHMMDLTEAEEFKNETGSALQGSTNAFENGDQEEKERES